VSDDDTEVPTIMLIGSEGSENDGQNQSFTWHVSDASGLNSVLVTISKDGSVVQTFTTANDSFDFNTFGLGTFDITVSATDADSDRANDALTSNASRSVVVTDDDVAPPTIVLGGSQGAQTDGEINVFTWDVSDASGLLTVDVTVTQDGNVIHTSHNASGS